MRKLAFLLLIVALAAVACGGDVEQEEEEPQEVASLTGDAARGEDLFNQTVIGAQPGCITCHSLEPDQVLVGPSMAGIAARSATRVSGKSAEEYLRESVLNADAFTVDGFSEGVMPSALVDELSDQQVADLVAFMLKLE